MSKIMNNEAAEYVAIPDGEVFEDDDGNQYYCARLDDGKHVKVAVPPISIFFYYCYRRVKEIAPVYIDRGLFFLIKSYSIDIQIIC